MITLLILISIVFAVKTIASAKRKYGFLLNHYTLHNVFWLMTIILSYYFNSYLVPVSTSVYYIFIFGLFFFNITILFVPHYSRRIPTIIVFSLKKRRIVEFVVLLFSIPQAYLNFKLIQQGVELWAINSEYWANQGTGIYIYSAIMQSVIAPLTTVLIATSFYNCYYDANNKSHYITIFIAILLGVASLLSTGGGRTGILYLGFMLLLSYGASSNFYVKNSVTHISKTLFGLVISVCIIGVSWATIERGHESVFQEFINRYTLCAPLFEYYYYSSILKIHTYGSSTFEFMVSIFNYVLRPLDLDFEIVYNNSIIQEGVNVPALEAKTNAYTTEYFNYIRDWGILGVMLGPYILAFLYNLFFKVLKNNSFYMLFFIVGVLSWNLESHFAFLKNNCLSIIYCLVLCRFLRKT